MLFIAILLCTATASESNVSSMDQAPFRLDFQRGRLTSTGRLQYQCDERDNCPNQIICQRDVGDLSESTNWECASGTEKIGSVTVKFEQSTNGNSFIEDSFYISKIGPNKKEDGIFETALDCIGSILFFLSICGILCGSFLSIGLTASLPDNQRVPIFFFIALLFLSIM